MTALTLPGDIPGLLRRGSPVVMDGSELPTDVGVATINDGALGWWCVFPRHQLAASGPDLRCVGVSRLALDLTDATGRAHAVWWLGAQRGLSGGMAVDLRRNIGGGVVLMIWAPGWRSAAWTSVEVPALAGLDPDDPRPLPDGSRWVDAEALRLVCLHVAGRAP